MEPNEPNDHLADDAAKDTARGGNLMTEADVIADERNKSHEANKLEILKEDHGCGYTVRCGDRWQEQLTCDEALWVVANFLMGSEMKFLRTKEEHEEWEKLYGGPS